MNSRIWKPNVTVAALVERQGRFLLVEEETEDGIRYNQPAAAAARGKIGLLPRRWAWPGLRAESGIGIRM